jgi:ABC-type lipoprotein export system ATPase subunit
MSDHPLIRAVGLGKVYRDGERTIPVLTHLDLEVPAGELLVIVGASGVGKSTLLHILGALDRPSEGQVCFDGVDLFTLSERELAATARWDSSSSFTICCPISPRWRTS